jgi:hypothetical protein
MLVAQSEKGAGSGLTVYRFLLKMGRFSIGLLLSLIAVLFLGVFMVKFILKTPIKYIQYCKAKYR